MIELHWTAAALRQQLKAALPGIEVEVAGETGSTNTDLLEAARAAVQALREPDAGVQVRRSIESRAYVANLASEAFAPRVLVAERQTGGRGRQGRSWLSEHGASLTFSLALALDTADLAGLSLAVGVALVEALDPAPAPERDPGHDLERDPMRDAGLDAGRAQGRVARPRLALKWPNDLWLVDDASAGGRKLGGVLIETAPLGAQRVAVIGIGLNVRPIAASAGLASGYASFQELEPDASAPALLARTAPALVAALRLFERAGFAPFHARYAARDLLFGQPVRTTHPDVPEGIAAGVTAQGSLLVRTPDGSVRPVSSGEVSVRLALPATTGAPAAA